MGCPIRKREHSLPIQLGTEEHVRGEGGKGGNGKRGEGGKEGKGERGKGGSGERERE